jgi:hypothetical protein
MKLLHCITFGNYSFIFIFDLRFYFYWVLVNRYTIISIICSLLQNKKL